MFVLCASDMGNREFYQTPTAEDMYTQLREVITEHMQATGLWSQGYCQVGPASIGPSIEALSHECVYFALKKVDRRHTGAHKACMDALGFGDQEEPIQDVLTILGLDYLPA